MPSSSHLTAYESWKKTINFFSSVKKKEENKNEIIFKL